MDEKKKVKNQGTWEEWWAGEKKYKIVVSSGRVEQSIYGTQKGVFVVEGKDDPDAAYTHAAPDTLPAAYFAAIPENLPAAGFLIQRLLTHPVPDVTSAQPSHMPLQAVDHEENGISFPCVVQGFVLPNGEPHVTAEKDGKYVPSLKRYCFDPHAPVLRIESAPGQITTLNSLVRFENRYLARSIRIAHTAIRTSTIHDPTLSRTSRTYAPPDDAEINVDLVEPLTTINEGDFSPPADAVHISDLRAIAIAEGVMAGDRLGGGISDYPAQSRGWRVQGKVEVDATILQDGSLGDFSPISGPRELQDAVLNSSRSWRYEPYLVGGQPVKVRTRINATFSVN